MNNKNYNNPNKSKYEYTYELKEKISISKELCSVLTIEEVNLPYKSAYKVAMEVKGSLNTNQLRKIFEQIKSCEKYLPDVCKARSELYKLLPLIAYAVGRNNCPKPFFELIEKCVCKERLCTSEDVHRLIEFITAIVAYVKFLSVK